MVKASKQRQALRASFSLGNISAESDPLLEESYFDNGQYEILNSKRHRECFLIGRTGAGKSAALLKLEHDNRGNVIKVDPEQLSLPYVLNLNVVKTLASLDVHMEPFFRALWEHVIIVEVLKHKHGIDSQQKQDTFLEWLKSQFSRQSSKAKAIDYLEEFGDKFWEPIDSRVRDITTRLEERIGSLDLSGKLSAGGTGVEGAISDKSEATEVNEERALLKARFQNVVNETQLPRLKEMIQILGNEILAKDKDYTYVLIDDLDKEWVDQEVSNLLIRCLFEAVIDLQSVQRLRVIVALRTNILNQLGFHQQRKGRQEEKIRGLTVNLRWNEPQLIEMIDQRFLAAAEHGQIQPDTTLKTFLPHPNRRLGDPTEFVMSRTLSRPRDMIDFANEIVKSAAGRAIPVKWADLIAAERTYSANRLSALIDEWKDPYLGIETIFYGFRNSSPELTLPQLGEKLDFITEDCLTSGTSCCDWLLEMASQRWYGKADAEVDVWESYRELIDLLYDVTFLGVTTRSDFKDHIYSNKLSARELDRSKVKGFLIHPAFRTVLNIAVIKNR